MIRVWLENRQKSASLMAILVGNRKDEADFALDKVGKLMSSLWRNNIDDAVFGRSGIHMSTFYEIMKTVFLMSVYVEDGIIILDFFFT